jgi:hypothetical protein
MATINIDVELDEFRTVELIRELRVRGIITDADERNLRDRAKIAREQRSSIESVLSSPSPLVEAIDRCRRGDLREALVYLVRAVPDLHPLESLARVA